VHRHEHAQCHSDMPQEERACNAPRQSIMEVNRRGVWRCVGAALLPFAHAAHAESAPRQRRVAVVSPMLFPPATAHPPSSMERRRHRVAREVGWIGEVRQAWRGEKQRERHVEAGAGSRQKRAGEAEPAARSARQ